MAKKIIIPMPSPAFKYPKPFFETLWIRFKIWRLHRYADGLIKEAEHHQAAAKMHTTVSSQFWKKANDARAAAAKLLGGAS